MIIFIKILENKHVIDINPQNTVLYLKHKIQEELNINIKQQRLIYNGYAMADENTMVASDVKENSIIHLLLSIY